MSREKVEYFSTPLSAVLGERLRQVREARGLSQEEVANRLQARLGQSWGKNPKSKVQKWEAGVHRPKLEILKAYSALFGRSLEWFIEGRGNVVPIADPMAGLTPKQRRLINRFMRLLDDETTARHLAGQIDLLEEALENMDRKKGTK